ncbi:MAG: C39 family peptidase [Dethiobacter sp.]|jgi:hypothetical protein|nr:C39 family peptidase [Dethiobacter sp.]
MKQKVACCFSLLLILAVTSPFSISFAQNVTIDWSNINQGYEHPSPEQIRMEQEKARLAEEYVKDKDQFFSGRPTVMINGSGQTRKVNLVGTFRQLKDYTCGPAAARNLIWGYVRTTGLGSVPNEAALAVELHTTTAGTEFHTRWQTVLNRHAPGNAYQLRWGTATNWINELRWRVLFTIDRPNGYNVIGNINHGTTATPVHPVYANGAAHYLVIHGYNDVTREFYISDSYRGVPVQFRAPYVNTANSTQRRGIVW